MRMNPEQVIDIYRMSRAAQHRYQLEQFERGVLVNMRNTVERSRRQIIADLSGKIQYARTAAHQTAILGELDELSLGLRRALGEQLTSATAAVGSASLQEAYNTLSLGGIAPMVNNVSLSPAQYRQFLGSNPIGGLLLPQWVDAAYNHSIVGPLKEQLNIGALRGSSYDNIVGGLAGMFDNFSRRELTTLTRTYFQEANVRSHQAVMEANRDVVEGGIWTTVSDGRCCIECLPLSENFYKMDEEHPPIPAHPNCRCMPRTKTVSFRDLGMDIDELAPIEQAVVTRGYLDEKDRWVIPPVGTGGGAPVREIRFYLGGLKEAFPDMPREQQIAMIGPKRYELLQQGKITLDDLVDRKTGRVRLLNELK